VLVGLFPELRPQYELLVGGQLQYDQVDMAAAIMVVMLAIAGLIMIVFRASPEETVKGTIMKSGIVAFISILGIAWLGSSFFEHNREFIVGGISGVIEGHPWVFAFGLFALSVVLFSQAATVVTLMPVGVALDIRRGPRRVADGVLGQSRRGGDDGGASGAQANKCGLHVIILPGDCCYAQRTAWRFRMRPARAGLTECCCAPGAL